MDMLKEMAKAIQYRPEIVNEPIDIWVIPPSHSKNLLALVKFQILEAIRAGPSKMATFMPFWI